MLRTTRSSLWYKLLLTYFAVAIPMVALIGIIYYNWYGARKQRTIEDRQEVAMLVASNFRLFVDEIVKVEMAVGRAASNRKPEEIASYLESVRREHPMASLDYLSPDGSLISSVPQRPSPGFDYANSKAVKSVIAGQDWGVGDLQVNPGGTHGFGIAAAVKEDGKLKAIIYASIDAERLVDVLPINLRYGSANLIDSTGRVVYSSEYPSLSYEERNRRNWSPVEAALSGRSFAGEYLPPIPSSSMRLGAEVPVNPIGWAAGSFIMSERALGQIKNEVIRSSLLVSLIVLASLCLGLWSVRRISRPILKLAAVAERIGRGDFDDGILVKTGDEIETLALSLDRMRLNIKMAMERISGLVRVGKTLNSLEPSEVERAVIESTVEIFQPEAVWLMRVKEHSELLKMTTYWGLASNELERVKVRIDGGLVGKALKEKKALAVSDVGGTQLWDGAPNPSTFGARSAIILPMVVKDKAVGVLGMFVKTPDSFQERELELITAFAAQVAAAVENARLYDLQRRAAESLQADLLPCPPDWDHFSIGLAYKPISEVGRVGGDFYDFLELPGGHHAIAIGDVSGKGIEAASLIAIVKNTVRAYAHENPSPSFVLNKTDEVIRTRCDPSSFVTLFYGVLRPEDDRLVFANAGHLPPAIFQTGNKGVGFLMEGSIALGVSEDFDHPESEITFKSGDKLILYTDGVTEARRGKEFFGEDRLAKAISKYGHLKAPELAGRISTLVRSYTGGEYGDDLAVVVIEYISTLPKVTVHEAQ